MFSDLERKILAFPGPTGCRAKVPKSVVRGRRSQEIAVTARACGPNAPGLGPWVNGGEARRPPDGWTVHGERALKTPASGVSRAGGRKMGYTYFILYTHTCLYTLSKKISLEP